MMFWVVDTESEKVPGEGAIPNLKGRAFPKERGLGGREGALLFYLPAWNVKMGPRGTVATLQ